MKNKTNIITKFDNFKMINETGEWDGPKNLEELQNMTDDEIGRSDAASWMKGLLDKLEQVRDIVGIDAFEIVDIKGFDMYQGPYASVKIKGTQYKVWTLDNDKLFIEDYPVSNTGAYENDGFQGWVEDIAAVIEGDEKTPENVDISEIGPEFIRTLRDSLVAMKIPQMVSAMEELKQFYNEECNDDMKRAFDNFSQRIAGVNFSDYNESE